MFIHVYMHIYNILHIMGYQEKGEIQLSSIYVIYI